MTAFYQQTVPLFQAEVHQQFVETTKTHTEYVIIDTYSIKVYQCDNIFLLNLPYIYF